MSFDLDSIADSVIEESELLIDKLVENITPSKVADAEPEPSSDRVFDRIYIFGDSLSDSGNIFRATGAVQAYQEIFSLDLPVTPASPPYFEGRFTNGLTWADNLAADLGLELTPSTELSLLDEDLPIASSVTVADETLTVSPFFNGATTTNSVNFAFGGAQLGEFGAGEFGDAIPGVSTQVDFFLKDQQQANQSADPDALYVIWGGANDYQTVADADPQAVVKDLETAVEDLYEIGARNFLIADLPDLGQTPRATSATAPVDSSTLTDLTSQHNSLLASTVSDLDNSLADAELITLPVNQLFEEILANPKEYGLTNTSESFLDPDTLTPNGKASDEYLFWDSIHPTATVHEAVGDLATETLLLNQAENEINGTSDNDTLTGSKNNDALRADRGNDELMGAGGDDVLLGGVGNDLLNGGMGKDSLMGGRGEDRFVLKANAGEDTIFDLNFDEDSLLLDGLTFAELSLVNGDGGVSVSVSDTDEVIAIIAGVDADSLGSENFTLV